MRTLLIASRLAGVGTTTTAVNLAAAAAAAGRRVVLVDADPAGRAAAALGLRGRPPADRAAGRGGVWAGVVPRLDVLTPYRADPADPAADLAAGLQALSDHAGRRYDVAVVDAPAALDPATSDALLRAAHGVVVVQRADPASFRTLPAYLERVKGVKAAGGKVRLLGILMTLPAGVAAGGATEAMLRAKFRGLLPHAVPFDRSVGRALAACWPLVDHAPDAPAAREYRAVAVDLGLVPAARAAAADDEAIERTGVAAGMTAVVAAPPRPKVKPAGAADDHILHTPRPARSPAGQTQTFYQMPQPAAFKGPNLLDALPPPRPAWHYALLGGAGLAASGAAGWLFLG